MLGIGSNVAMMSCIMTVVRDRFKSIKNWQVALVIAILGISFGSVYMTPVRKIVAYFKSLQLSVFFIKRADKAF